jgi:hypothetical protein
MLLQVEVMSVEKTEIDTLTVTKILNLTSEQFIRWA